MTFGDFSFLLMPLVSSVKDQSKLPNSLLVGGHHLDRVMFWLKPFDFNDLSLILTKYLMFPYRHYWLADALLTTVMLMWLSICLTVCLSVCLSVCLPACLPACLPVYICMSLLTLRPHFHNDYLTS